MAYRFAAREMPGVFLLGEKSYKEGYPKYNWTDGLDGRPRFTTPKRIAWLTDVERLPDMVKLYYPIVSQRLRDLIERLDPGAHVFHPVTITMKGGHVEQRYHLEVGRRFDAVSSEHSNWTFENGWRWVGPPTCESRLVLDARVIGDAHLWENGGLMTDANPLASDTLALAAWDEGITGLLLERFEQTGTDGRYDPPPLSADRVYALYQIDRVAPDGFPARVELRYLDGDVTKVRPIGAKRRGKPKLFRYVMSQGGPVDPLHMPTRAFYRQAAEGNAPDLFTDPYVDLPMTVSERLRQLIERFEPGVHQFLPLTLFDGDGAVLEKRHFFVRCAPLDGPCYARAVLRGPGREPGPGDPLGRHVVDRAKVAGRHVWIDGPGGLYVSSEVASVIADSGWPGFGFGGFDLVG